MYRHLKELAFAEYVEQKERGIYTLTEKGQMTLLTVFDTATAMILEKRIIPEEVEATFWESRKEEKSEIELDKQVLLTFGRFCVSPTMPCVPSANTD